MPIPLSKSKASESLEQIGVAIRSARVLRRLTQEQLAGAVGVSRPTVVAAEAGRNVSSHNLFALLGYLGVRLTASANEVPNQVHRRPNIAELMSAQRVRRQGWFVSVERTQARREIRTIATMPAKPSVETPGRIAARSARPRIGELIAAERERRNLRPPTAP